MKYINLIILMSFCAASINAYIIVPKLDNPNYKVIEETVDQEIDSDGNIVITTSYKIEDPMPKITKNFDKMKNKFIEDQKNIFDDTKNQLLNNKADRESFIDNFNNEYNQLLERSNNNIGDLGIKKLIIRNQINEIENDEKYMDSDSTDSMKISEDEYRSKLEQLKERKYLINALMTQHCDVDDPTCDELIREYKLDVSMAKVDKDIADLEAQFLKQAQENEENTNKMKAEKLALLNSYYSQLVDLYEKEEQELENKNEIIARKDNMIYKLKEYMENLEYIQSSLRSKIEDLTSDSLDFNKLTLDDENNQSDNSNTDRNDEYDETTPETTDSLFSWFVMNTDTSAIPSDSVKAGYYVDGTQLYVIRSMRGDSYIYGKHAFSNIRNSAFVTDEDQEYAVDNYEILTSKSYYWCSSNVSQRNDDIPICRASFEGSLVPGTLTNEGNCRFGMDWEVNVVNEFEVLSFEPCSNDYY